MDRNPDKVRAAHAAGDRAVLGDVAHPEVLEELGCRQARLVVVNINDTIAAEAAVRTIRATAPQVAVIARAPYEMDMEALRSAGGHRGHCGRSHRQRRDSGHQPCGAARDAATRLSLPDTPGASLPSEAQPSFWRFFGVPARAAVQVGAEGLRPAGGL